MNYSSQGLHDMAMPPLLRDRSLLLLSVLTIAVTSSGSGDEAALLAFRAEASTGDNTLASWNSSAGFCSWEGVTCSGGRNPPRVVALRLPKKGLAGTLSTAIGNLTFLRALELGFNALHGDVPASIGHLRRLRFLDLRYNAFSGELPANLSSCVAMQTMFLNSNNLSGRIPAELGNRMTQLQVLRLKNNSLTGPIPASLANASSLHHLSLAINQLDSEILPELANIAGLRFLDLSVNKLHGALPLSLYNLSSLRVFHVEGNRLHGSIPADIGGKFPAMDDFSLANNRFTGGIPSSISNLTNLTSLQLSINGFTGLVPRDLGRLQHLQILYLTYNLLEADDREGWEFITSLANCSQLLQLSLSYNSFRGQLPSSVVNLSATLQYLYLSDSDISGSIPQDISNLVGLSILDFANTSISGVIPESIGKLANMVQLGLYRTRLSGLIPSSLGNLTQLNRLLAYGANLEGPIPASLGKLRSLYLLDLSANYKLNGSIPKEIFLPSLSSSLNLSYNSLSGPIPSDVGKLVNLNQLILSGNQLSSQIPDSIGNCAVLESLLLDENMFEGSIPQSLKNMKGLQILNLTGNKLSDGIPDALSSIGSLKELYLAHNNLSGVIPGSLQKLTSLLLFDASFNDLQGEVPNGGVFGNLTAISITGNTKLCGGIPQLRLNPCSTHPVAVKVFNLLESGSSKSFEAECEALRSVRHRCLIKIITCCSSIDNQGQDFKALVIDLMPNGSLDGWLHPKYSISTLNNTLSVAQRLDIAVNVMDALDYLHNHCQPPIVHCDVKPSNILLAEDMSARVGDFGISRIMLECANKTPDRILEIADPAIWLHNDANDNITRSRVQECLASAIRIGTSCSKQQPRERMPIQDTAMEMHAIRDANLMFISSLTMEHEEEREADKLMSYSNY